MHRLRIAITILVGLVVIIFAVANRHAVTFSLSPLPWDIDIPLFALVLLTFALGVIAGGLAVWSTRLKKARRAKARQLAANTPSSSTSITETRR